MGQPLLTPQAAAIPSETRGRRSTRNAASGLAFVRFGIDGRVQSSQTSGTIASANAA